MREREQPARDFGITPEIREGLLKNPDTLIVFNQKTYRISYGSNEIHGLKGLPPYTAYCLIEKDNEIVGEISSLGVDKENAKRALGFNIYRIIKLAEQEDE